MMTVDDKIGALLSICSAQQEVINVLVDDSRVINIDATRRTIATLNEKIKRFNEVLAKDHKVLGGGGSGDNLG